MKKLFLPDIIIGGGSSIVTISPLNENVKMVICNGY